MSAGVATFHALCVVSEAHPAEGLPDDFIYHAQCMLGGSLQRKHTTRPCCSRVTAAAQAAAASQNVPIKRFWLQRCGGTCCNQWSVEGVLERCWAHHGNNGTSDCSCRDCAGRLDNPIGTREEGDIVQQLEVEWKGYNSHL